MPLWVGLGLVLLPLVALAQSELFSVTDLSPYAGMDAIDVGDWLGDFTYVDGTGSYWCVSVGGYGPAHTILLDEETTVTISFETYKTSGAAAPARLDWEEWNGSSWDNLETVEAATTTGVWLSDELVGTYPAGLYRASFTILDESCGGRIRSASAQAGGGSSIFPTPSGLPFLTGGTPGGYCYDCRPPAGFDIIGSLAYLACMLVNVASCYLWSWLMSIVNVGLGTFNLVVSLVNWLLATAQSFINFFASGLSGAIAWLLSIWDLFVGGLAALLMGVVNSIINSAFIQEIWSRYYYIQFAFEVAKLIAELIVGLIRSLMIAMAFVIDLIIDFANALVGITDVDAIDLNEVIGYDGDEYGEITDSGWNLAKVIVFTLWGLGAFDNMVASTGLQYIQLPIMAVLTLGVVLWTIRRFQVTPAAS